MASLYKKPVVVKDNETGKRTKTDSKKWWGRYRDEFGQDKRVPLAADKRAAQKMLERIVGKVERTKAGLIDPETLARLPMYTLNGAGDGITPTFAYVWMWPLTTILTLSCGILIGGGHKPRRENSQTPVEGARSGEN